MPPRNLREAPTMGFTAKDGLPVELYMQHRVPHRHFQVLLLRRAPGPRGHVDIEEVLPPAAALTVGDYPLPCEKEGDRIGGDSTARKDEKQDNKNLWHTILFSILLNERTIKPIWKNSI